MTDAPNTGEATEALMAQIGDRVRRARQRQGIPRRVLSELSGVSPRYLANLETGQGNVSVGVLLRVADALGERVEHLLADDEAPEARRIADLFRAADAPTRARVREILAPEESGAARGRRIALIGLRGAGKSTLGRKLGTRLDLPFVELNAEIEAQSGMPVTELIALYGQEGYRRLEASAIGRIADGHEAMVLAVAGGIVSEPETYEMLLARFHTIWLRASPAEHMERVRAQGDMRPMAGNPAAMDQLRSILTSREAQYARAGATLDTSGRGIEQSLSDLVVLVTEQGFLTGGPG
ncbi:helix-turn-helix transcriptional regulator [Ponticoccus sp. SC2-23]|uniref:helix-turn-helix transcriptional regulator n=1 Tax=Alexandriicola marinus TaxID=2081710 RepID=UPI000FDA53A1|nr:helix-turn-helix transcriptional regulator [Alexandriicola marinus]MBM1221691.1 helix-turn-helix transcriptional regulator [Ponticoccus sp. SC6-9]MBM1226042.1 helix-turn-helix transcriptional regulator [Ponticoccus sp. SC6-15]MBM1231339.1 helix-turn-helix transcriptional regulator [Ponticoccus sp. SC6-38]MBM1235800.1 helix-turn-helix transcriptional regulator [Ponticoccus sp. SC6-45]MBM1240362.1 helix-turn-helix transcriptional regulator [Ponticoccus sp. SC6-49]MBM1244897.1 helix-turn-heli